MEKNGRSGIIAGRARVHYSKDRCIEIPDVAEATHATLGGHDLAVDFFGVSIGDSMRAISILRRDAPGCRRAPLDGGRKDGMRFVSSR